MFLPRNPSESTHICTHTLTLHVALQRRIIIRLINVRIYTIYIYVVVKKRKKIKHRAEENDKLSHKLKRPAVKAPTVSVHSRAITPNIYVCLMFLYCMQVNVCVCARTWRG